MRVAIFASGTGTNFTALAAQFQSGEIPGDLVLLFADHPDAPVMQRAQAAGVPAVAFTVKEAGGKQAYEERLLKLLQAYRVDLIALAGYLRVVGPTLLKPYAGRIINLHPAWLPEYPGLHSIERAFNDHRRQTGVTVHYIDAGLDTGPIIAQERVPIKPTDTLASLAARVHEREHRLYPAALKQVLVKLTKEKAMKRALVSVADKTGLVPFVTGLVQAGYEIVSTGGTQRVLTAAGLPVIGIEDVTHFPEILDGRVKTLNPYVHGGLLARRDQPAHLATLAEHQITPIDLVCVNLYPFKQTIAKPDVTLADAIENIDIGGPAMIRSAAKNYQAVTVVTDVADYDRVLKELATDGTTTLATRADLGAKAFRMTAAYDALIADYLTRQRGLTAPEQLTLTYNLKATMRYGENRHQPAWLYEDALPKAFSILAAKQLHGKQLSYNNIKDADEALRTIREFKEPTAVGLKHMNPCGIGRGDTIERAWDRAYMADPVSIFGGVVALNRPVDLATAQKLHAIFLEIIIAPAFDADAETLLAKKKHLRLLTVDFSQQDEPTRAEVVSVMGGLLRQSQDVLIEAPADWQVVTKAQPTAADRQALAFAWKAVKHVKSNAIVVAKADQTLGIGAGQPNRVDALKIAVQHAGDQAQGAVLASDAFFPFGDSVEYAGKHGIRAIVQPGGSIRDQESIDLANQYGMVMVTTGVRHFRH